MRALCVACLLLSLNCGTQPQPSGAVHWVEPEASTPFVTTVEPGKPLVGFLSGARPATLLLKQIQTGSQARHIEVTTSSEMFENWADVPGIVQAGDGSWISHWLEMAGPDTYDYGIKLSHSRDQGETWVEFGWLNDDAWGAAKGAVIAGEHGFVSWVAEDSGARAFWLDGRMAGGHGGKSGAMQLRTTTVVNGVVQPSQLLDDQVCDCCPTAAVNTSKGAVVAFRDRTDREIRDIHVLRQTAQGWVRTTVDTSAWQINGCPVNGPALASEGDLVLIAWFSGQPEPTVYAAWSVDGGKSFGEPKRLTTATLGRVTAVVMGGRGYVGWLSPRPNQQEVPVGTVGGAEIQLAVIEPLREVGAVTSVAVVSASRRAGIPRLVATGGRLGLAWTEVLADAEGKLSTRVRYREFEVSALDYGS